MLIIMNYLQLRVSCSTGQYKLVYVDNENNSYCLTNIDNISFPMELTSIHISGFLNVLLEEQIFTLHSLLERFILIHNLNLTTDLPLERLIYHPHTHTGYSCIMYQKNQSVRARICHAHTK